MYRKNCVVWCAASDEAVLEKLGDEAARRWHVIVNLPHTVSTPGVSRTDELSPKA